MPVHWFWLECWSELGEDAVIRPACGASRKEARGCSYVQRLTPALRHPVAETAEFAAQVLGELEAQGAVPVLIETLGRSGEPYLQAAAARSLKDLQAAEAVPALREVLRSSWRALPPHGLSGASQRRRGLPRWKKRARIAPRACAGPWRNGWPGGRLFPHRMVGSW